MGWRLVWAVSSIGKTLALHAGVIGSNPIRSTKLLRSKQLLLFLLSKTKDGVRFPVWKLGATCSLFTLITQLYRGSSSVGLEQPHFDWPVKRRAVGSNPTSPTHCPVSLMVKHCVDIAETHARFVYGVRSSIWGGSSVGRAADVACVIRPE